MTSVTVQRKDQAGRPPCKRRICECLQQIPPQKVEVNEATVEEAIKYGHFLKRSDEDIAEAIDIYKTLGKRHSMVQKKKTQRTSKNNQNNDYPPNMIQKIISALYKPLHLDK